MSLATLRPLSLGDILSRSFSLYRDKFFLLLGIVAIPQFLAFTASFLSGYVARGMAEPGVPSNPLMVLGYPGLAMVLVVLIVACSVVYLFIQGGAFLAVSELYLGRPTTIEASFKPIYADFGPLLVVVLFQALAIVRGTILLIIPGLYATCRLLVSVPVALAERRGPSESLRRSFELTRGFASRSFLILLVVGVLNYALTLLVTLPIHFLVSDPATLPSWNIVSSLWTVAASILVSPVLVVATSVFYYDLRVRKENFDLQAAIIAEPGDATRSDGH